MARLTHFSEESGARMVDVGAKDITQREAVAAGRIFMSRETLELILTGTNKKGGVLGVAQLSGIMGAKRTSDLIPLCHPVMLSGVDIDLEINQERCCVDISASVRCGGQTGVEMEALTAVSVAALTIYDMCKAAQKDMVIGEIRLLKKSGGKSGTYIGSECN